MKLRGAMEENSGITQEIASMKMTLMKLQTERLKAGGKATHEVDAALAKVGLCCLPLLKGSLSSGSYQCSPSLHHMSMSAAAV